MKKYLVAKHKGDPFAAETVEELVDQINPDNGDGFDALTVLAKDAGAARLGLWLFPTDSLATND
jgi:hypothetical protein